MPDINEIRKLLAIAKSPKEKEMYQQILNKLEALNPPSPPKPPSIRPEAKTITTSIKPKPNRPLPPEPKQVPQIILKPQVNPIFQAIGIIRGDVQFDERNKAVIKIGELEYPLLSVGGQKKKAYYKLREEVNTTGITNYRLVVYPKVIHFPDRDTPYLLSFQLVGFVGINSEISKPKPGLDSQLNDNEFILRGLWQFIPVCKTPCISIHKNYSEARVKWIKGADALARVRFMKGSHIPLLWKDASVKPFRYNPKAEQQGKTFFVAVKAKFLPQRNVFAFIEELGLPLEEAPQFLKASKKLKAEVMKIKKDREKEREKESSE